MNGWAKDGQAKYVWLIEEHRPALLISRRAHYSQVMVYTNGEVEFLEIDNDDIEFYDEDDDYNDHETD